MKIKTISIITLAVFLICAVIGIISRKSYRKFDINQACVGVFWESMLDDEMVKFYEEEIPKSKNILCVRVMEDFKAGTYYSTQKVEITKVFKSENLKVGDKIKISPNGGAPLYVANEEVDYSEETEDNENEKNKQRNSSTFFEPYVRDSEYGLNMNFVNKMDVGENYLVFLDKEVVKNSGIYVPSEDFFFSPFFSYKEKNNTPAGIDEEYSYKGYGHAVKYENLKNNEFFGDTQKCIDEFNKIKKYLIEKYPE